MFLEAHLNGHVPVLESIVHFDSYSYRDAQCSRKLHRYCRDAVFSGLSLGTTPILRLLCLSIAGTSPNTFVRERETEEFRRLSNPDGRH